MNMHIHPVINNLDLSRKAKVYFNKLEFYEIIEDPIIISAENIKACNQWSFGLSDLTKFTKQDIKVFIEAVIKARRNFLIKHHPDNRMVFYFWYDDMSGNFYFNVIPLNNEYSNEENTVSSLDDIINDYFADDACRGVIKFANLIDVDLDDIEEYESKYKYNLWSTIIP